MISADVVEILQCPSCQGSGLGLGPGLPAELVCSDCGARYPVVDGIPDMVPRESEEKSHHYRTDTLRNGIAPLYDLLAPAMSALVWNCPPIRYVDAHHRGIGRTDHGVYLECPVGTGLLLGHVRPERGGAPIVGVDLSWRMLRRAQRRLQQAGLSERVTLMRADPEQLPLKPGAVNSVQSVNGLHGFHDRQAVLAEFHRVLAPAGHLAGSTLVRGGGPLADMILRWFEQYGVTAPLRSREFVIQELEQALGYPGWLHETYGSAFFFSAHKPEDAA